MPIGAFVEPLVVISLLAGGTWVNRARDHSSIEATLASDKRLDVYPNPDIENESRDSMRFPSTLGLQKLGDFQWQRRRVKFLAWNKEISSPSTAVFSDRVLSRLLRRFPFLVEVWYWALIYWVYQLARAFTAVTLVQGTVHTARDHALRLIDIEQRLNIFWEPAIQHWFLQYPALIHWVNRIYSFIHIPGTILFLVWLYYVTITSKCPGKAQAGVSTAGSDLYQRRRRTMAMCNMLAFQVFTIWPCMRPRLLSDPSYHGPRSELAKSYGFVDTVHAAGGESSVWTTNRFCNQYAAMPSLHFGYSLLIGLTIATIPFETDRRASSTGRLGSWRTRPSSMTPRRAACVALGLAYPLLILLVVIATANHFILDAVAGALICGIAWNSQSLLLNLLPVEDCFLWCLRLHKPTIAPRGEVFSSEKC